MVTRRSFIRNLRGRAVGISLKHGARFYRPLTGPAPHAGGPEVHPRPPRDVTRRAPSAGAGLELEAEERRPPQVDLEPDRPATQALDVCRPAHLAGQDITLDRP